MTVADLLDEATVRQLLERERRAQLHRQIGALAGKLQETYRSTGMVAVIRRIKLERKIRRLNRELNQLPLLPMQ